MVVGYKCALDPHTGQRRIVTLEIPPWAKTNMDRYDIFDRNTACMRASEVRVLEVSPPGEAVSGFYKYPPGVEYKVGCTVLPDHYEEDRHRSEGGGIHFFLTREVAENFGIQPPPEGVYKRWYEDGCLHMQVTYRNGLKDGECKIFYRGGRLQYHIGYRNDKLDGGFRRWHANGQLAEHGHRKDGNPVGELKTWYENGRPCVQTELVEGTRREELKTRVWSYTGELLKQTGY